AGGAPLRREGVGDAFEQPGHELDLFDHLQTRFGAQRLAFGLLEQVGDEMHRFGARVVHSRWESARDISRFCSRSLMLARLSCICLPRTSASSTLTRPSLR